MHFPVIPTCFVLLDRSKSKRVTSALTWFPTASAVSEMPAVLSRYTGIPPTETASATSRVVPATLVTISRTICTGEKRVDETPRKQPPEEQSDAPGRHTSKAKEPSYHRSDAGQSGLLSLHRHRAAP